jgi:hypothetical protein
MALPAPTGWARLKLEPTFRTVTASAIGSGRPQPEAPSQPQAEVRLPRAPLGLSAVTRTCRKAPATGRQ